MTYKHYALILVGVALVAGAGWGGYTYWRTRHMDVQQPGTVIDLNAAQAPSLDHTVSYDPELPKDVRTKVGENIATLVTGLKQNGFDFNNWMDLAINYKVAGDYDAAQAIWEYVYAVVPTSGVAAFNLGNLNYLTNHDYPKAEEYFLEAIKREPTQTAYYLELAEMYRYAYKQEGSAFVDLLQEGLKKVPNDPDFLMTLGSYSIEVTHETAKGIEYFLMARDEVSARGNIDLARQIDREIARIKSR
jgi:tetratricopeptide (TPR) repeat protein